MGRHQAALLSMAGVMGETSSSRSYWRAVQSCVSCCFHWAHTLQGCVVCMCVVCGMCCGAATVFSTHNSLKLAADASYLSQHPWSSSSSADRPCQLQRLRFSEACLMCPANPQGHRSPLCVQAPAPHSALQERIPRATPRQQDTLLQRCSASAHINFSLESEHIGRQQHFPKGHGSSLQQILLSNHHNSYSSV